MTAMTGYITTQDLYFEDNSGNLIESTQVQFVKYIVHGADRLNLTNPLIVTTQNKNLCNYLDKCELASSTTLEY